MLESLEFEDYNRVLDLIGDTLEVIVPFKKIETIDMTPGEKVLDISKTEFDSFLFTLTFQLKNDDHYR